MPKEIENIEDIRLLMRSFYQKVLDDETLGKFFAYVRAHHWEKHLEVLDGFWSSIAFHTATYDGNPIRVHATLHHFSGLNRSDFEQWLKLFFETVDELFTGEKAEQVKQRASSIATIMQIKILER